MTDGDWAMSELDDFQRKFDEEGRFRGREGMLKVVFAMRSGPRFPGELHFRDGLCARAEMDRGGHWGQPDGLPIHGIRFLLDFGDEKLHGIRIDQGRVFPLHEVKDPWARRDFLGRFRVARNLFVHPQRGEVGGERVDAGASVDTLARSAIWLTPKSVAGFEAADFPELGPVLQAELQTAVQNFLAVATQVPADKAATKEQYGAAGAAFARILEILTPYLPVSDEAEQVEAALRTVELPSWVVNWDYELDNDSDGIPSVWVKVFADDQAMPRTQLGRAANELTSKVRQALSSHQVRRLPYLRMSTALEHKVG
jgi:hypothetical protein